jgi:hypothetical protein
MVAFYFGVDSMAMIKDINEKSKRVIEQLNKNYSKDDLYISL